MRLKRAALELSSSFLVGIIFGIVLLIFGLAFAFNIAKTAESIIDPGLPSYFDMMAKECVQKGEKVCVPEIKKTIPIGKIESFGVVINNVAGSEKRFKPSVAFSRGILEDESEITTVQLKDWTYTDEKFRAVALKDKEDYLQSVPIKVPFGTKPGTYIFNINICYDSNSNIESGKCPNSQFPSQYGTTSQISITVP